MRHVFYFDCTVLLCKVYNITVCLQINIPMFLLNARDDPIINETLLHTPHDFASKLT